MQSKFEVLFVEDSQADALILKEVLKGEAPQVRVHVVTDGLQALDFLTRAGAFHSAPRPHLILLDLNLPRMEGMEVLGTLKSREELLEIPVVIFSSSKRPEEITRAYRLHANGYIVKPHGLEGMTRVVKSIVDFWCNTVALPI